MAFDPKAILQGNADKLKLEENPSVGFTASGAGTQKPTDSFGTSTGRMAGPGGSFAMKMMSDPNFANNVAGWDKLFAQSNQGMEFNQAKIQLGAG